MQRVDPYFGPAMEVPLGPILPPPQEIDAFVKDIQRRSPPLSLLVQHELPIQVIGVLPADFAAYARQRGWTYVQSDPTLPMWNGTECKQQRSLRPVTGFSQRPALWHMRDDKGKELLVLCTAPSREEVSHWASMLDQLLRCSHVTRSIQALWHENSTEAFVSRVLSQTKLAELINDVQKKNGHRAILLVGYTQLVNEWIAQSRPQQRHVDLPPHFKVTIREAEDRAPLVSLTVGFCLRGTMATELVRQMGKVCDLGGIAFFTKASQQISCTFADCMIPGSYYTLSPEGRIPKRVEGLRQLLPHLASRLSHLSSASTLVPAAQLEEAARLGAYAHGNEPGYLARGCGHRIPFITICQSSEHRGPMRIASAEALRQLADLGRSHSPKPPLSGRNTKVSNASSGEVVELPLRVIDPSSHAMGVNLVKYVINKSPPVELYHDFAVKVVGVAEEDLPAYARSLGWTLSKRLWDRDACDAMSRHRAFLRPKTGNTRSAALHQAYASDGTEFRLLTVIPSMELVHHYGLLVRQQHADVKALFRVGSDRKFAQSCIRGSGLSASLNSHDELNGGDALLVLGYGELTAQCLSGEGYRSPYADYEEFAFRQVGNGLSYCLLTKEGHDPVVLVNVDFTYWGSMAGEVARGVLETRRFKGLVLIAKAGQMAGPHSLREVYCPASFSLQSYDGSSPKCAAVQGLFSTADCGARLTGDHVTCPSTLLETTDSVQKAKAFGSVSTDIEAAHVCQQAEEAGVRFGALFFASDFVRAEAESQISDPYTLVSDIFDQDSHKSSVIKQAVRDYLMPVLRKPH